MKEYELGRFAGLDVSFKPSAILGTVLLWILFSLLAIQWFGISSIKAFVGGVILVLLHWASVIVHHLGHAWAAYMTGYPMAGIRLCAIFGISIYPLSEGCLPATIHIRRALGGPIASLVVTLVAISIVLILEPMDDQLLWIGAIFFMDNLIFFTLGSLVPMGINDGSTLLRWWGK